jgi:uncharacterized protein
MTSRGFPEHPTPLPATERTPVVDAVRGLALLGILLVNMSFYAQPIAAALRGPPPATGRLDRIVEGTIELLAEGKSYPLFALLFGFGLHVQLTRAGTSFRWVQARRLAVLAAIGAAHALLLWSGDILLVYAVLGALALAFVRRRPRTLLLWALLLLTLPVAVWLAAASVRHLLGLPPPSPVARPDLAALAAQGWQRYGQGSYLEVTRQRARDYALLIPSLLRMAPPMLAMVLTGLWVARRRVLQDPTAHRRWLLGVLAVCLPLGLVVSAAAQRPGGRLLLAFDGPPLAFAYAAALALLSTRRRLTLLEAAGRMPLSNYLLQSLVCTTIFYGYGAGLLGRLGPAALAVLAVAVWGGQLVLSTLWLRRFRCGPLEGLWRSLTYARWQRWRR